MRTWQQEPQATQMWRPQGTGTGPRIETAIRTHTHNHTKHGNWQRNKAENKDEYVRERGRDKERVKRWGEQNKSIYLSAQNNQGS